ncbi:unnamed protein product [Cuscuta epithymum]|uniref:Uncharacterized protein n=1 Tax=Cuscuta epithymum TaxID=186058 RepID=A0AAV0EZZ9_9ASTE|nr:unnamed protein product [Cuscuta epithymum]
MAAPLGCFPGGVSPPGFPSSGNLISKPINTSKSFLFPNGVGSYFNLCSSSLVETAKSLDSSHHALRPVPKRGIVACIDGGAGIEPVAGSFLDPNPIFYRTGGRSGPRLREGGGGGGQSGRRNRRDYSGRKFERSGGDGGTCG